MTVVLPRHAAERAGVRFDNRDIGIYFGSRSLSARERLRDVFLFLGVEACFARIGNFVYV